MAKGQSGTIPNGTRVSWHYRGAIGHGTIKGVSKRGTSAANTEYSIRESDHHPGEPAVVRHYGRALTRHGAGKRSSGRKSSRSRGR